MSHPDVERWSPLAAEIKETRNPLSIPFHIALNEAVGCAKFMKDRWEPNAALPGLRRISKTRLPWDTHEELLSLIRAIQEVQTRYLLEVDPMAVDLGVRARFLIDALRSAITFLLDDGAVEPADLRLAQLKAEHARHRERAGTLSQMLSDYAALAEGLKARLVELDEDFDPALIDEAEALAGQLLESPTHEDPGSDAARDTARDLRILRNRLLVLLIARMRLVRSGAAYVFAQHPWVAREATSAYERKRRSQARAEAAAKKKDPGEGPSTQGRGGAPPISSRRRPDPCRDFGSQSVRF
jgi:hypothetical protein